MKYRVTVTEIVYERYDTIEIEAETEDEARDIAEEMRVNAELPDPPCQWVEDVRIDIREMEHAQ